MDVINLIRTLHIGASSRVRHEQHLSGQIRKVFDRLVFGASTSLQCHTRYCYAQGDTRQQGTFPGLQVYLCDLD